MQLYTCKVRHAGSLYNEIPKIGVTAAEVAVLKVLHGDDAVVDIKGTDQRVTRTDAEERGRLHHTYGPALRKIEGVGSLNGLFGVAGALPKQIDGVDDTVAADKPRRVKRGRPAKAEQEQPEETADETEDELAELA